MAMKYSAETAEAYEDQSFATKLNYFYQLETVELGRHFRDEAEQADQNLSSSRTRKLRCILLQRMIKTIEACVGVKIQHTGLLFLKDHPGEPYFYQWWFAPDQYPAFPPKAFSNWSLEDLEKCNSALEDGYLKVRDARKQLGDEDKDTASESVVGSNADPIPPERDPSEMRDSEYGILGRFSVVDFPPPQIERFQPQIQRDDNDDAFAFFISPLFDNWKSTNQKLNAQELEIEELRATNESQATRILELEKKNEEEAEGTGLKFGLEFLATELGKYKKGNEDLRAQVQWQTTAMDGLSEEIRVLKGGSNGRTSVGGGSQMKNINLGGYGMVSKESSTHGPRVFSKIPEKDARGHQELIPVKGQKIKEDEITGKRKREPKGYTDSVRTARHT